MEEVGPHLVSNYYINHMARWNLFDVVNSVILKFPAVSKFPADDFNFRLLFSHSKNIRMSALITIIITY